MISIFLYFFFINRRHECIGRVTHAFFDTLSKNIVVGTEENVIANLNTGSGNLQYTIPTLILFEFCCLIFRQKSLEVCLGTKRFQRQNPLSYISRIWKNVNYQWHASYNSII